MSLPASNRKAPSRAVFAAALSALAVVGTASASTAQQGYAQPSFGYAAPGQLPAGYGFPVQPASTFGGIAAPGYAQPAPVPAPAPVAPGYGVPQPFPGYGVPGAPVAGFNTYAPYGIGSQWSTFAPSEPNYAPHERAGSTEAAAVAPAEAAPAPAPAPIAEAAPAPAPTPVAASDYSYEVTPATGGATYVGPSVQLSTGSDPYTALPQQTTSAPQTQPAYEVVTPSYTQEYDAAAVASVPAQAPTPQTSVNVGGYEYQTVPAADYFDIGAQANAAPAAVPAPVFAAPAPAVAPSGTHFVQVGAFLDPARANRLIDQLGSAGVQAFIVPAQVRGKLYHRVRVGAASKRDAELVLDQVRGLNFYEARIVRG